MTDTDSEGDRPAWKRFWLIADMIGADSSLLRTPLASIERWLGSGHRARRELTHWRGWIAHAEAPPEGMARLLQLLRDDSEQARDWKGFSLFPGLLTKGNADARNGHPGAQSHGDRGPGHRRATENRCLRYGVTFWHLPHRRRAAGDAAPFSTTPISSFNHWMKPPQGR